MLVTGEIDRPAYRQPEITVRIFLLVFGLTLNAMRHWRKWIGSANLRRLASWSNGVVVGTGSSGKSFHFLVVKVW